MTAILLSLATFVSTLVGGMLAFRLHRRIGHVLAFTSGVLLGVVFFEVVPEIFRLAAEKSLDPTGAMVLLVAGIVVFRAAERFLASQHAPALERGVHGQPRFGVLSALALIGHSALDGVAIGLAFQASNAVGIAVAIAVISHDFCDGLNTVGLMLGHGNARPLSAVMLVLDAIAPVAGAASTLLLRVPDSVCSPISDSSPAFCSRSRCRRRWPPRQPAGAHPQRCLLSLPSAARFHSSSCALRSERGRAVSEYLGT